MEYIEREALMSKLDEKVKFYISDRTLQGNFAAGVLCDMRDETIAKFPSADVAPVRRGSWNSDETCPFCGKKSTEGLDAEKWDYWFPDFCPHCGAMLNGGEQDA